MQLRGLYILIHVLVWLGFFFVLCPEPLGLGHFRLKGIFSPEEALPFFLYGVLQNALLFYSYAHIALPYYIKNSSWQYFILANAAFLTGFVLAESFADYEYMKYVYVTSGNPKPFRSFSVWLTTNTVINGIALMAANLYGFTYDWFKDQRLRLDIEQEKLRAELSALKHQIHPHFLFNILNGLYGLAFKNNDEPTAEGIAKLSQMMRYMLYESNDPQVPMVKEIEYIENYIDLQKIRINAATQIHFSVQGNPNGVFISPMIMIPFIENAFKHGISTVKPSDIHISIALEGKRMEFTVVNPIHQVAMPAEIEPGGIGLQNVKKRLDLLYTDAYTLEAGAHEGIYRVKLTVIL